MATNWPLYPMHPNQRRAWKLDPHWDGKPMNSLRLRTLQLNAPAERPDRGAMAIDHTKLSA